MPVRVSIRARADPTAYPFSSEIRSASAALSAAAS